MARIDLYLDSKRRLLRDSAGRTLDLGTHRWVGNDDTVSGTRIGQLDAAAWLQRTSGRARREPVAVVGGRHASADDLARAHAVGAGLAIMGCVLLCGGRGGVARAACEGAAEHGGTSIGLLPGDAVDEANAALTIPLATGLGAARSGVIARAALCMVAIGGGYNTLAAIASGLEAGKPVFALPRTPPVDGVKAVPSAEAALDAVARVILALDVPPASVPVEPHR